MGLPTFKDDYPEFNQPSAYRYTNEEPETFNEMLKGKRFNRVGAIASGGEITLFCLLPRAKEVVVIDHCYGSLASFWAKVLLLDAVGPVATKKLLVEQNAKALQAAVDKLREKFPEKLQATFLPTAGVISEYEYSYVRREWHLIPNDMLIKAAKRLDRITMIHGDIVKELPKYGPFDCLYVSNAQEHYNRDKKVFKVDELAPMVKPNGLMLATGGVTGSEKWKIEQKLAGFRTTWLHQVCKLIPPAVDVKDEARPAPATGMAGNTLIV